MHYFKKIFAAGLLAVVFVDAKNTTIVSTSDLLPFAYDPLPLGSIIPNGWLRTEIETSAAGLGGHLFEFYRFVSNSTWIGGDFEYSVLNEALPYWVNALVPLSYTLNDDRLKKDVHHVVDSILDRVQADGWIGPETLSSGKRMIWARTLLFFGLTNLVEANATHYEKPIVGAMHRFNGLMNSMLRNNGTGIIYHDGETALGPSDYTWLRSRVEELMVSLQWLLDHHPGNQSQKNTLMENIAFLHHFGYKWEGWYSEGAYVKDDLYNVPSNVTDDQWPFLHGVTVAEGLKYAAVLRRSTANESLLTTAKNGVDWTFKYHGSASGTILADERIDGANPYYGSELCTDVETIYSLAYNYFAIGDPDYAERAEVTAFNALPAAMSGDWWSHQYMTQPNQPYSKNLSSTPFYDTNTQSQTFGLEPNYPCCTVNHPQGFPKFTMYSFLRKGESGIVHALLSPGRVDTQIRGGKVFIDCETKYPFDGSLSYTIKSDKKFDFYVRVPSWSTSTTIQSSNSDGQQQRQQAHDDVDKESRLRRIEIPPGKTTKLTYTIDTELRTEPRANDTIAIYNGSILYGVYIKPIVSSGPPKFYNNQSIMPASSYPSQATDHVLLNSTEWNIAIDPSTLAYHSDSGSSSSGSSAVELPSPTFEDGQLPMFVSAKGCAIDWPLFLGAVPGSPIPKKDRKCLGDVFEVVLRPYGSSKLHMAEIPTIDLGE